MLKQHLIFRGDHKKLILDFDVDSSRAAALLVEDNSGLTTALVAGAPWFSWEGGAAPSARRIKWIGYDRIAVWSFPDRENHDGVLLINSLSRISLPVGTPSSIFSGSRVIFVCYGEDQNLLAATSDIESNVVVALDLDGNFIFGLGEKIRTAEWPGTPIEVSAACVTEENQLLFALYNCDDLWLLDPFEKSLERISFPVDVRKVSALSVTREKIFFVTRTKSELRFMSVDKSSRELRELGLISNEMLFGGQMAEDERPHRIRIHGAMRGMMLVLAGNRAFSVELPS